jgi:hypothetical protein
VEWLKVKTMSSSPSTKKNDPTHKRAGGVVQAVEHLPIKCEALSSNPSTDKKKKKNPKRQGRSKENLQGLS